MLLLSFAVGLLVWTFLEYALHCWVFHNTRAVWVMAREHRQHHRETDYFATPLRKLSAALPILAVLLGLGALVAGLGSSAAFAGGVGVGWLAYEGLHRIEHVAGPRTRYGRWARRHHFHHHFVAPNSNHGVTSPYWDWVFGTLQEPGVVRVPRRQAERLPWLLEPADREGDRVVRSRYARDYLVV